MHIIALNKLYMVYFLINAILCIYESILHILSRNTYRGAENCVF